MNRTERTGLLYIYRPHPNDDPILPNSRVPPSFPMGGAPLFLTGGYPILPDGGYPSHWDWMGYPPSGLDGGTPIGTEWGYPPTHPSGLDGWGTPPPPVGTGWSLRRRTFLYAEVFTLERELYRYPVLKLPGTGLRPVAYQAIVAPFPGTLPRNLCVSCSHSHCYVLRSVHTDRPIFLYSISDPISERNGYRTQCNFHRKLNINWDWSSVSPPCMLHTTHLFIGIGKKIGRSV